MRFQILLLFFFNFEVLILGRWQNRMKKKTQQVQKNHLISMCTCPQQANKAHNNAIDTDFNIHVNDQLVVRSVWLLQLIHCIFFLIWRRLLNWMERRLTLIDFHIVTINARNCLSGGLFMGNKWIPFRAYFKFSLYLSLFVFHVLLLAPFIYTYYCIFTAIITLSSSHIHAYHIFIYMNESMFINSIPYSNTVKQKKIVSLLIIDH